MFFMITASQIIETVKKLCIEVNYYLGSDCVTALNSAMKAEKSDLPKEIIGQMIENIKIAGKENMPICQDTGIAVIFAELGQDAEIKGGGITEAINEGVRQGYKEGYLRKSIVKDPLRRENTGDNTPAVIHYDVVQGDKLKIIVVPKGAGSENKSQIKMFTPHAGIGKIEEFIIDVVKTAGADPCPPVIVGVGIGGTFEKSAILSKRALLRPLGLRNKDPFYADLEKRLLDKINKLGIGPMGIGGATTCLDVFIETYPCHIASLPVSVNIQCWVARHKEAVL